MFFFVDVPIDHCIVVLTVTNLANILSLLSNTNKLKYNEK